MFHRLWVRPDPEVAELRQEIVDPGVLQEAKEIDTASCSMEDWILFTKGLFPHPGDLHPRP
eukprot:3593423-Pyramimonas_sp.AAC.1